MDLFDDYIGARDKLFKYFNCDTMFNTVGCIYIAETYFWCIKGTTVYTSTCLEDIINNTYPNKTNAFQSTLKEPWIFKGRDFTMLHLTNSNRCFFEIYTNELEVV